MVQDKILYYDLRLYNLIRAQRMTNRKHLPYPVYDGNANVTCVVRWCPHNIAVFTLLHTRHFSCWTNRMMTWNKTDKLNWQFLLCIVWLKDMSHLYNNGHQGWMTCTASCAGEGGWDIFTMGTGARFSWSIYLWPGRETEDEPESRQCSQCLGPG